MRRFRRSLATRLFAASGVGCNDFGGRTGIAWRSSCASRSINASCAFSAVDFFGSVGSIMLVALFWNSFATARPRAIKIWCPPWVAFVATSPAPVKFRPIPREKPDQGHPGRRNKGSGRRAFRPPPISCVPFSWSRTTSIRGTRSARSSGAGDTPFRRVILPRVAFVFWKILTWT